MRNWNREGFVEDDFFTVSFYRTYEELKPDADFAECEEWLSFYRTYEELKPSRERFLL